MSSKVIVVTGFGPFKGHEHVNASWEAVKQLPDVLELDGVEYSIRKIEVPVSYEDVEVALKYVWALQPLLVIHCGVNGKINHIALETNARNGGFCSTDVNEKTLACSTVPLSNNVPTCEMLQTQLDVDRMARELNSVCPPGNVFQRSDDVGTYLCCFIYLKSLDQCTARTLFIHVPPISPQFSPEFTSHCIQQVILKCIPQRC